MKGELGDKERIIHILESMNTVFQFTIKVTKQEFDTNLMLKLACSKLLADIGEASSNLSEELKSKYFNIPWKPIKAMRNFIIHEYFGVDYEGIWEVIVKDLPNLEKEIMKIKIENNY